MHLEFSRFDRARQPIAIHLTKNSLVSSRTIHRTLIWQLSRLSPLLLRSYDLRLCSSPLLNTHRLLPQPRCQRPNFQRALHMHHWGFLKTFWAPAIKSFLFPFFSTVYIVITGFKGYGFLFLKALSFLFCRPVFFKWVSFYSLGTVFDAFCVLHFSIVCNSVLFSAWWCGHSAKGRRLLAMHHLESNMEWEDFGIAYWLCLLLGIDRRQQLRTFMRWVLFLRPAGSLRLWWRGPSRGFHINRLQECYTLYHN